MPFRLTPWLGFIALVCVTPIACGVELVTDHQPRATLVTPDKPLPVVSFAAEELQYHIERSTGAKLPIVPERDAPTTGPLVLLGSCTATEAAGVATEGLPPNGFILRLVGNRFYMAGDDTEGNAAWVLHGNRTRVGTLFAVYEFLERHMGIRWLWPGELGEVIPKRSSLSVSEWEQTGRPAFVHTRWRDGGSVVAGPQGWSSPQARSKFLSEQGKWLRRNRFAMGVNMDMAHAFTQWWDKHSKAHPEYFNLLPDGTRRSDPTYHGGSNRLVSMSVAEPGFWQSIIEHWQETRTPDDPHIDCSENDTSGRCTCPKCLAWDVPDPNLEVPWEERLTYAKKAFEAGDKDWCRFLGSLADRYARFYLAVQEQARKIDPGVVVMGYAYANYVDPPRATKLNDHIVIGVVPPMYFPWTDEKRQANQQRWDGWRATGARMFLRPNWMLDGHNMPLFVARKLGQDFRYFAQNGMIGTDFDSLTGQYATQGPNLYMLARLHCRPKLTVEQVMGEYFSAFGKAAQAVRAYFSHWESVCDGVSEAPEGIHWSRFYRQAEEVFTPETMARGGQLLDEALRACGDDPIAGKRVALLQDGLKNARLTLAAQRAYRRYRQAGDIAGYREAIDTLDAHRAAMEGECATNMGYLAWAEAITWDRELLRLMTEPGERLAGPWKFMWDPGNSGEQAGWQKDECDTASWLNISTDGPWEEQPVGTQWRDEHQADYDGLAWYRTTFETGAEGDRTLTRLIFGAVDEACVVWVNGVKVLDRPYPYQGNTQSWQEAFEVDISHVVRHGRENALAVRVEDNTGAGGIWRPVWLVLSRPAVASERNVVSDSGFEVGTDSWKRSVMCGKFTFTLDETAPHTGSRCAKLQCTEIGPPQVEERLRTRVWGRWHQPAGPVVKGKPYHFRAWVKTSADFCGRVALWVTGANGGTAAANALNTGGIWRQITMERVVPDGEQVGLYLNLMDSMGTAWFDDVELAPVE